MDNITYELTRHGKIFKCPHCYETGDNLEEFNKTLSKLNLKHSEKLKEFTKGYFKRIYKRLFGTKFRSTIYRYLSVLWN